MSPANLLHVTKATQPVSSNQHLCFAYASDIPSWTLKVFFHCCFVFVFCFSLSPNEFSYGEYCLADARKLHQDWICWPLCDTGPIHSSRLNLKTATYPGVLLQTYIPQYSSGLWVQDQSWLHSKTLSQTKQTPNFCVRVLVKKLNMNRRFIYIHIKEILELLTVVGTVIMSRWQIQQWVWASIGCLTNNLELEGCAWVYYIRVIYGLG